MKCVKDKQVAKWVLGTLLLSHTFGGIAAAAPVTISGSTVSFSFDDALTGLFGPASVSGDTLYFTPTSFEAQSLNGAGYGLTNDTVNIKISAHHGVAFTRLDVTERGDYLLLGSGSTADVAGQVRAFDLAAPLSDTTAPLSALAPLTAAGLPTHNWQAHATVDLKSWGSRSVNVTIENLLLASSNTPSSLAFVEKKFVGLTPVTVAAPVPEPEAYAMMLVGLGLVGFAVARRSRNSRLA